MAGITDDEFWNSTPAELDRRQWAYWKHLQISHNNLISTAWLTAMYFRQKRLPSLRLILNPVAVKVSGDERVRLQQAHEDMVKVLEG